MEDKDDCGKCLGAGEIFNGKNTEECRVCNGTGYVNPVINEAFYPQED